MCKQKNLRLQNLYSTMVYCYVVVLKTSLVVKIVADGAFGVLGFGVFGLMIFLLCALFLDINFSVFGLRACVCNCGNGLMVLFCHHVFYFFGGNFCGVSGLTMIFLDVLWGYFIS